MHYSFIRKVENSAISFRNCLLLMLLIVGLSAKAQLPAQPMTFTEAMEQMLSENGHIRSVKAEQKAAGFEAKAIKGLRYPRLALTATYVQMGEKIHLDLTPVQEAITPLYETLIAYGDFSPEAASPAIKAGLTDGLEHINEAEWDETIQAERFGTMDATLIWPIFTGGLIDAANEAAKIHEHEAEEKLAQITGEQMTELVQRYFGLRLAENVVEVRKEVMDGIAKHLSDAKKLETNGMIAAAERLHAEVAFADAEREYLKSKRDADLIRAALMGTLESETIIQPSTPLFMVSELEPLSEYKIRALKHNPQLNQVESKKRLAEQGIKKEKAAYMPDLFVMGMANIINDDLSEYIPRWYVGVGLKYDLFDGKARSNKLKAAHAVKEQVEALEQKARFDIQTLVTKNYLELENAREQYNSLGKSVTFADEYLRVRTKAFQQGFATSTEVTDANMNLSATKIKRLKAVYEFDVKLATLLQTCGESKQFEILRTNNQAISYE